MGLVAEDSSPIGSGDTSPFYPTFQDNEGVAWNLSSINPATQMTMYFRDKATGVETTGTGGWLAVNAAAGQMQYNYSTADVTLPSAPAVSVRKRWCIVQFASGPKTFFFADLTIIAN